VYLDEEHSRDQSKAKEVSSHLEYTVVKDISLEVRIVYDPNAGQAPYSVIEEDREFVESYYLLPDDDQLKPELLSPWLLRIELNMHMMQYKGITFQEITDKIKEQFADDVFCIHSDENADKAVLRIRLIREKDESGEDGAEEELEEEMDEDVLLRKVEEELLTKMPLRGITNVKKVYIREDKKKTWDPEKGFVDNNEWVLDTDGSNLLGVLSQNGVDTTRTVSNDCLEIFDVLGIEALRRSLLNEMRAVISFDGSYVNYRHLATLCDVMTYRGILLPITRHGINRNDSGPMQRCSFEETVEILMDAAAFAETDPLRGVSENIMVGNLAPLGTGHFELYLNEEMLEDAIENKEEDDYEDMENMQGALPSNSLQTPMLGSPAPFSPGAAGQFSPGPGQFSPAPGAFSPGPQQGGDGGSSSPTYTSPAYSPSSPAYSPSSPAYSPSSPAYSPSSPAYSPSSPAYSPSSPAYSPSSPAYSPSSPAYSPSSPAYSPSSPAYSPSSPAYSPSSPAYSPSSPAYSPSSPAYSPSSPAYSPSSPAYSPSSPAYSPSSPAYSPSSPAYSPSSPAYSPSSPAYSPSSPAYSPSSPAYSPSSPAYSPSSPAYSPSSPAYSPSSPAYSPSSPAYSPSSPTYEGEQKSSEAEK